MKTATKTRRTSVPTVQTGMTAPTVTTVDVDQAQSTAQNDPPSVREGWLKLYEAVVGKRRIARQRGLVAQQ